MQYRQVSRCRHRHRRHATVGRRCGIGVVLLNLGNLDVNRGTSRVAFPISWAIVGK